MSGQEKPAPEGGPRRVHWVFLAAIVLLAFILRVYKVDQVPDGLFCDEAGNGYNAFALGEHGIDENGRPYPLYIWSFASYKNPVFIYGAMLTQKVAGVSRFGVRLTSVLFGTLTVAALFWLGLELWGPSAGLLAAAFLAVTPWHFHFSRIAFELIAFPLLFILGFAFLVRALRRREVWSWLGAAFFFAACPYSYLVAFLVVPVFLVGALVLFLPEVWRARKAFAAAVLLGGLVVAPSVRFQTTQPDGGSYFRSTTWIHQPATFAERAARFAAHYGPFYSYDFLFERGDPIPRHSTGGHGELHRTFLPLIVLGVVLLLAPPRRLHLLVLWWAAVYPLSAALMTEIPSATRGILGSPIGPLIAAYGVERTVRWLQSGSKRRLAAPLVLCLVATGLAVETARFLEIYYGPWRRDSARGYGGFQFGYQEALAVMERLKDRYPQRLMTAYEVNNPDIIVNFYTRTDPRVWSQTRQNGYRTVWAEDYSAFDLATPTLFAMRESDLFYFDDYDVLETVRDPNGRTELVIADVRRKAETLRRWRTLGPLPRVSLSLADAPPRVSADARPGLDGPVAWQAFDSPWGALDFFLMYRFGPSGERNLSQACAEAVATVDAPAAGPAVLELFGATGAAVVWVNGAPVQGPVELFRETKHPRPVALRAGPNDVAVRACSGRGFMVTLRLLDAAGRPMRQAASP